MHAPDYHPPTRNSPIKLASTKPYASTSTMQTRPAEIYGLGSRHWAAPCFPWQRSPIAQRDRRSADPDGPSSSWLGKCDSLRRCDTWTNNTNGSKVSNFSSKCQFGNLLVDGDEPFSWLIETGLDGCC